MSVVFHTCGGGLDVDGAVDEGNAGCGETGFVVVAEEVCCAVCEAFHEVEIASIFLESRESVPLRPSFWLRVVGTAE